MNPCIPFALSLSKGCSSFWDGGTEEKQCFDRLSTNGIWNG